MPLGETVAIRDVEDVDGFVNAAINKLGLRMTADEREELELDGFEIMCELSQRYTPTHGQRGWSFCSYAGEYLPRRLLTKWHQAHRGEHIRTRDEAGRSVWRYAQPTASLNALMEAPTFDEAAVVTITRFQRPAALAAA